MGRSVPAGIIGGVTAAPEPPANPLRALLDGTGPTPIAASFDDQVTDVVLRQAVDDGMDVAEVRVDRFASTELVHASQVLTAIAAMAHAPTLLTVRSAAEGGRWQGDDEARAELLAALTPFAHGVDVELALTPYLGGLVTQAKALDRVVVVSVHDFERTPPLDELEEVVRRASATGADLVKVACTTGTEAELEVLAELTRRHAADGVIVLGMGELGARSRVELPGLGSRLVFAVAPGQESVPGQMTVAETAARLREVGARP